MEIATIGTFEGHRVYIEQLASLFKERALLEIGLKVSPAVTP